MPETTKQKVEKIYERLIEDLGEYCEENAKDGAEFNRIYEGACKKFLPWGRNADVVRGF